MVALICFVLAVLASRFKSKSRLEAENAVLRHQLIVLQRKVRGRAHLTNNDRWFFVQMYRWFPSIMKVVTIIHNDNRALAAFDAFEVLQYLRNKEGGFARPACAD